MTIGNVKEGARVDDATENCYQTALSLSSSGQLSIFWLIVLALWDTTFGLIFGL